MSINKLSCGVFLGVWLGIVASSFGIDNSNVLVLYNSASPDGAQIASYYSQIHPGVTQLALTGVPTTEDITWDVYLNTIRPQVLSALTSSIDCIVTTKGLPLRIYNPKVGSGAWNVYSSLESELTRVDTISTRQGMGNQAFLLNPSAWNPYSYENQSFDYEAYGIRLTSRMDGFSVSDVTAAIDRARNAVIGRPGYTFLIDDDPCARGAPADKMESLVSTVLAPRSVPYTYDQTTTFLRNASGPVIGYVSHGIYGGAPGDYILNSATGLNITPAAGGVFHTYESYNAYTFNESSIGQMPVRQGLIAEWLRLGGAAGVGNVQEPGVSSFNITNEDRMFEMLLDGYTWAEAAWNATQQLSFVNTVVGDPLMRFRQWVPGDADLDGDVDLLDISTVEAAFGTRAGEAGYTLMADMNADGVVDLWDLNLVEDNYSATIGLNPPSTLPEPSSLALLILAGLGIIARRRSPISR